MMSLNKLDKSCETSCLGGAIYQVDSISISRSPLRKLWAQFLTNNDHTLPFLKKQNIGAECHVATKIMIEALK
nr:hypothetical protein [Tanacetum cinerariifolium]